MQKDVGSGALPLDYYIEALARSIGNLPSDPKSTGWHVSRFISVSSAVITGSNLDDPYDGKLSCIWVCLGEPSVGVFVPIFPFAGDPPSCLSDMYQEINDKRHEVYDYTGEDSGSYSDGRNIDHTIDPDALCGVDGYYGEGGIQEYTFGIENWAFSEYDQFMAQMRQSSLTDAELQQELADFQNSICAAGRCGRRPVSLDVRRTATAAPTDTRRRATRARIGYTLAGSA